MKNKFEQSEQSEQSENNENNPPNPNEKMFNNFYEENINWMNDSNMNPMVTLKAFYPAYFQGDTVDYTKIHADLLAPYPKKSHNKAHEVFKCLFKMPYKTLKNVLTADLKNIEREFGADICAHGVEESKGGMYNLLLMCISNQVQVPSDAWGAFISGLPNISPVSHGPYYLIYSLPFASTASKPCKNTRFSDIARILVPFQENKEILTRKLEEMVEVNLITSESKEMFINKLVTYQELLHDLRAAKSITELQEASSGSFFNPPPSSPIANKEPDMSLPSNDLNMI